MDIRHLKYFIAISEEKSLSAASRRLGVAQPSLSQHVIRLEDELGIALMTRSAQGVQLTDEGHLLLRHAHDICDRLAVCLAEMKETAGKVRGRVAFGMPPSVSMVMSVPLAETVRVEFPEVRLQAVEAMSGFIENWITDQTVDIGFLYNIGRKSGFHAIPILDEQLCFFSSPDNWPLATEPDAPTSLAALQGLDLILPSPSHGLRKTVERHALACGLNLNVVIEMDAMTQIKELVARGSGYTVFAPAAAHDFVARGELVKAPITDPDMSRPVYLVHSTARPMSRACQSVQRLTLEVARDLVRRGIWEGRLRDLPPDVAGQIPNL